MTDEEESSIETLNHPATLKLFLFAKSVHPKDFGVREAKRSLDFNSPSTVLWHLEKLEEAEFIEKLPTNRYRIVQKGLDIKEISIPVKFSAQIIKGELIPRRLFLISFLISTFIVTLILIFINPLVAAINGAVLAGLNCIFYILNYLTIKKQLSFYNWEKEQNDEDRRFLSIFRKKEK
ncbi:MAG: hypothetical protein ACTSQF_14220 [Candidatus Heimdallarchaeaceae archaeon]